ncbi:MAG TPA: hypothetical protein PKH58_01435 [Paludibacteraceae bacterium]|nr:hypothetical protein [Paludibacteraceae bacterium]
MSGFHKAFSRNGQYKPGNYMPAIGEIYQGGKVAFIAADESYILIVAEADSDSKPWYPSAYSYVKGISNEYACGADNDALIIAEFGAGDYAAKLASYSNINKYNDWYIPSVGEWQDMVQTLTEGQSLGLYNYQKGGMATASNEYWTSTNINTYSQYIYAVWFDMYNIGWDATIPTPQLTKRVRLVRKLTAPFPNPS